MSLARAISRGFFLNARFGGNGTKNAWRSFGTVGASGRVASDIFFSPAGAVLRRCRRHTSHSGGAERPAANRQGGTVAGTTSVSQRLWKPEAGSDWPVISSGNTQLSRERCIYKLQIVL